MRITVRIAGVTTVNNSGIDSRWPTPRTTVTE